MDIEKPLISIITVVLNGAKTVEQAIQSVITQPYKNKEYIIIDGGSTDGTLEIIRKYEDHLSFWESAKDKGIYDAINKGIEKSKGELIGIINADDWYEENVFEEIAKQFKEAGSDQVIYGMLRIFQNEEFYSIIGNSVHVLNEDTIMHPASFIPSNIYKMFGKYNCRYHSAADYELFLRYVQRGVKFKFIENTIANFRRGGTSFAYKSEKEKYRIRLKYKIISIPEYLLRMVLLKIGSIVKELRIKKLRN